MDTTITTIGDVVVAALENAGYSQSTIGQYRKSIKWLGALAEKRDGVYTRELGGRTWPQNTMHGASVPFFYPGDPPDAVLESTGHADTGCLCRPGYARPGLRELFFGRY